MIINHEKTINTIVSWLKNYIQKTNLKSFVILADHDVNSYLTFLLAQKTQIPTFLIKNPFKINSLREPYQVVNFHSQDIPSVFHFCEDKKGILIGTFDREEYRLLRRYEKHGSGRVDLLPIADLYKYELCDLLSTFADHVEFSTKNKEGPDKLTSAEIEWADGLNERHSIITQADDPVNHYMWPTFSMRQQQIVAKMHQIEKLTRHKNNPNLPVCEVRKITGLVR